MNIDLLLYMLRQLTISLQLRILFHFSLSLSLLKLAGITSFSLILNMLLYYLSIIYQLSISYLSVIYQLSISYLSVIYQLSISYLFYYLLAFIQLNREIISGWNKIPFDLSILLRIPLEYTGRCVYRTE